MIFKKNVIKIFFKDYYSNYIIMGNKVIRKKKEKKNPSNQSRKLKYMYSNKKFFILDKVLKKKKK